MRFKFHAGLILAAACIHSTLSFGQATSTPRTVADLVEQLQRAKPDPARAAQFREIADRKPPESADRIALATFHFDRARAAAELGRGKQNLEDLRLAAQHSAGGHDSEIFILLELVAAENFAGQMVNALAMRERMQARTQIPYFTLVVQGGFAYYEALQGDTKPAAARLARAEAAFQDLMRSPQVAQWYRNLHVANLENWRCRYLAAQGKLIEAEAACRIGITARIEDNKIVPERIQRRLTTPSLVSLEFSRDSTESFFASVLSDQGRFAEAELVLRGTLERVLGRTGPASSNSMLVLSYLAENIYAQGRYSEAERLASLTLDIANRAGLAPEGNRLNAMRELRAASLAARARWKEANTGFEEREKYVDLDPVQRQLFGKGSLMWALSLMRTGNAKAAREMMEPIVELQRRRVGDEHQATAEARGFLALALAAEGEREKALAEFRAASKVLLEPKAGAEEQGGAVARGDRLKMILEGYIGVLYDLRAGNREAAAEAFLLADVARGQSVQRAVTASAARFASGDPALSQIVRREQDLSNEVKTLYEFLLRMLSAPPEQQLPQVVASMRKRIGEIEDERKNLYADIEKRFPAYANLISPRPATVAQVQKSLRPAEALISVLSGSERTYVWAIPQSGDIAFSASKLGESDIQKIVTDLRKSLDPGDVALERLPAFDLAEAHRLYTELLAPGEAAWKKADTLLIATGGTLGQLPFSVLPVTAAPAGKDAEAVFDRYRSINWLARTHAVASIPSANALVTLRALPAGSTQRLAFLGFGDPVFDPKQSTATVAAATTRGAALRNLTIARVDPEKAAEKPVEWTPYSQIAPLPDTRQELLAIAGALKADPQKDVVLGAAATPDSVRKADLGNRRIVAFATHGLLAGDLPGLTQPALAMAAPAGADVDKNPNLALLRMEDILGLKMNADWVVLSACNTAGSDGQGAEAVSGLGRAFFYAGSRALLVTHWPVETTSARRLVTDTFERYAGRADISRAQALRQAMLELLDKRMDGSARPVSYAHPLFWAPYALVGDAGR